MNMTTESINRDKGISWSKQVIRGRIRKIHSHDAIVAIKIDKLNRRGKVRKLHFHDSNLK
jgi:hypothetical protein